MRILILLMLLTPSLIFAQSYEDKMEAMEKWQLKGFEFYIAGGAYFANKNNANFYNGSPENTMNLGLIFNNEFVYDKVSELVIGNYAYVDTIALGDLPQQMRFVPSMAVQLGFKYRFKKNWYFTMSYAFTRAVASGEFEISFPNVIPSNVYFDYAMERLVAKEDRSTIDLSFGYIFHQNHIVKPFLELGAQFNYLKIKSYDAYIEGTQFDLLSEREDPTNPGYQSTPYNYVWGGAGFGVSGAVGVKFTATPSVSIDPVFTFSMNSMGHRRLLTTYDTGFYFNYAAMVRIIISDAAFFKNQ